MVFSLLRQVGGPGYSVWIEDVVASQSGTRQARCGRVHRGREALPISQLASGNDDLPQAAGRPGGSELEPGGGGDWTVASSPIRCLPCIPARRKGTCVTETRDDRQTNPSQEELENSFEWARPKADFLIAELTLPFRDRRPLVVPGDEIAPFSVSRGGAEIEVTPAFRIQELTGGPMTWLDELKAIVSRQIDPTLPLRTIVDQVVEPGREVLHQTLRHLREAVDDPRIDVHLDGLRLEFFEGPERSTSGLGLFEAIANLRLQKRGIDHGYWRAVIKAVVSNQRIPMERELVLDAERYLADGNHHFALLYAAFAGERLVFRLLYEALQATGKYQRAEAQKVAEGVSKADAARLLLNFYEIPLDTLRAIE